MVGRFCNENYPFFVTFDIPYYKEIYLSNHKLIENKILSLPNGSVFTTSDFADLATDNNRRQITFRLENEGKIRHILPSIYDRPEYSNNIQEYSAPNSNRVAYAIARKNNWRITPSENAC